MTNKTKIIIALVCLCGLAGLFFLSVFSKEGALAVKTENRVVRLEKLPDGKIFKTSWGDQLIWVVPRSLEEQKELYQQAKNNREKLQSLSGPTNDFRSMVPQWFVFATEQNKQRQVLITLNNGDKVPCEDFFLVDSEMGSVSCQAIDTENRYVFDSLGLPIASAAIPLSVPPQFINNQKHLVIGGN